MARAPVRPSRPDDLDLDRTPVRKLEFVEVPSLAAGSRGRRPAPASTGGSAAPATDDGADEPETTDDAEARSASLRAAFDSVGRESLVSNVTERVGYVHITRIA